MSADRTIRVLVIHDDPIMRAGLFAALANYGDIEPVIPHLSAPETLAADVLVTSHANGIEIAEGGAHHAQKILIVATSDNEWEIRRAIECGIAGYLMTGCPLDNLAIGVRAVDRGSRYFSPRVAQRLAESLSSAPLTGREEAVLQLVVDGLCNKAIANRLGIALGTVKTHLKAIFDKLSVETRTQAVITVARRGLLRQRMDREAKSTSAARSDGERRAEFVSC